MRFSRYLAMMASTWVAAAATVAGFTLLVDAIGISPIPVAIAGFNAWKPLRQDYDWIVKRYDVGRRQPTTIFMGSSRIKQTIDSMGVQISQKQERIFWIISRPTRICIACSSRCSYRRCSPFANRSGYCPT